MMNLKEIINSRYVIACLIVGVVNATIILGTGALFGSQGALVAATLLGSITISLVKKIKKSIRPVEYIDEDEVAIKVLRTNYYNVAMIVFAYFGIAVILSFLYFGLLGLLHININVTSTEDALDNTLFVVSTGVICLITFFITGFLYARTSTNSSYLGATVGAVIIIILNAFTTILFMLYKSIDITGDTEPYKKVLPYIIFWTSYIGLMLFGAYLGFRKRKFIIRDLGHL